MGIPWDSRCSQGILGRFPFGISVGIALENLSVVRGFLWGLGGSGGGRSHCFSPQTPPQPHRLLLQAGYDPDVRDKDGWTPLHAAAHWGVEEACRLLAEHLCDMAPRNNVVGAGGARGCRLGGILRGSGDAREVPKGGSQRGLVWGEVRGGGSGMPRGFQGEVGGGPEEFWWL